MEVGFAAVMKIFIGTVELVEIGGGLGSLGVRELEDKNFSNFVRIKL